MSYILDALQKSERERQRADMPNLSAVPVRLMVSPLPARRYPYLIGAAILLGAGVLLGWWRPWGPYLPETGLKPQAPSAQTRPVPQSHSARQTNPVAPPAQPLDTTPEAATPPPARPEAAVALVAPTPAPVTRSPTPIAPDAQSPRHPASRPLPMREAGGAPTARPVPDTSPRQNPSPSRSARPAPAVGPKTAGEKPPPMLADEQAPAAEAAPRRPAAAAEGEGKPPQRVLQFSELPPAVASKLPRLTVSGYAHSDDPGSRVVVINDKMLLEGEQVSADLKLERIGADGVVLNYKGYRFRTAP